MLKITVKAARVNVDFTQREAAKKLGITRESLMKYEKSPHTITYDLAEKMSKVYKIPKDNLIFLPLDSTFSCIEDEVMQTGS